MTNNEIKNAIHCMKAMIDEEVCEECALYGTTGTDHCEADCVRVAIKALEQTRWIPVSERLPEEHVYDDGFVEPSVSVLVQLNNKEMKVSRYWGSRESYKDEPWIDLSYPTTLEVVAWMPLPKPYNPQESEKVAE